MRSADVPPIPPSAAPLVAYRRRHGIDAEIVAPGVPMPTVSVAAAAIGVPEDHILKSRLFRDQPTDHLVLAIARGTARINRARLAAATGLVLPCLADATTVFAATGYPAGGVPPIAHATSLSVVLDRRAATQEIAYAGGGAEHLLLRIRPPTSSASPTPSSPTFPPARRPLSR